ncbi:MAG: hypothetical protein ACFFCW_00955 [Candidatus Hodarchaeota archaeon]
MGIKVIQQRVGYCGQKAIELVLRKDIEVIAAMGHRNHVRKDICELVGLDKRGINNGI